MAFGMVKWHERRQRYFGEYRDAKGKRRTVFAKKQKDCVARLRKAEQEVHAGTHTPKSETVTFGEALDHYLAECDRRLRVGNLSPSTVGYYRYVAEKHVRPQLGAIRLDQLTTSRCQDLIDELTDKYVGTPQTARKVLRGTFETAVRREWLARNPLSDRKLVVLKHKVEITIPTKQDLSALLAYVLRDNDELLSWRLIVLLSLFAGGMRKGELAALRWQDLDWLAGTISIRHSVCGVTRELKAPKTPKSRRVVPMTPQVRTVLQHAWQVAGRPFDGFVIVNRSGNHVYEQLDGLWKRLMIGAGVVDETGKPKFTLHAMRHACVSLLAEKRVPIPEISNLVGHKTTEMTVGVYSHMFKDAADTATPALVDAYKALAPWDVLQICDSAPQATEASEDQ